MANRKEYKVSLLIKSHRLLFTIFLAALIALGIVGYAQYQKYENKLAFQDAQRSIDSIYEKVISSVGKPDISRRQNSCSRPSQEWTLGPLSCSLNTEFVYAVNDRSEANEIHMKFQKIISSENQLVAKKLSKEITDELVINTYYHSAFDSYTTLGGLDCAGKYVFDTPQDSFLHTSNGKKDLYIAIGCTGPAKIAYYTVAN